MAALIQDSSKFQSTNDQEWSQFIKSLDGIIIVTPQYNWGYPGELKNALDHLYWEWAGKPVALITYGGHGGDRAREQLQQVLQGGFKMNLVGDFGITLPKEYIRQDVRVGHEGSKESDKFLDQHEGQVAELAEKLFKAAVEKKEQKRDEL
jgi:NAD(P)H-dependent FMN reductase